MGVVAQKQPSTLLVDKDVQYYDSLTYAQYLNKDYKSLISSVKEAEKRQIKFPYRNYRAAIANFELKNYAKAAKYYEKAQLDFPDDIFLKESLYHAYKNSGQKVNAEILAKTLPWSSWNNIGYKPSALSMIGFSGGYSFSDNKENIRNNIPNLDSINQYQDMTLGSVFAGFNFSERVKLNAAYNLFSSKFERHTSNDKQFNDLLSQHQFNLGLEWYLKNNFSMGVSGGFYAIEKNNKNNSNSNRQGNGKKLSSNFNYNLSFLAFVNKRFTYISPEISFAYSNFESATQWQSKLQLTYYPFGNLNFYGTSSGAVIYNDDLKNSVQTIFSQSIGLKLVNNLWLNAGVSYGNHLNYITERSFIVYDTYDPIKLMVNTNLTYYYKKLSITGSYVFSKREGEYFSNHYIQPTNYHYHNQLINLSIEWNF